MPIRSDPAERREQWSVSMTRSTKATNRMASDFEKANLPGAPLRNRTVDLLLTIRAFLGSVPNTVSAGPAAAAGPARIGTCGRPGNMPAARDGPRTHTRLVEGGIGRFEPFIRSRRTIVRPGTPRHFAVAKPGDRDESPANRAAGPW
jgi:hypothetical protein